MNDEQLLERLDTLATALNRSNALIRALEKELSKVDRALVQEYAHRRNNDESNYNLLNARIAALEAKAQATEHMLRRDYLSARLDEIHGIASQAEHPNRGSALDEIILICERAGV